MCQQTFHIKHQKVNIQINIYTLKSQSELLAIWKYLWSCLWIAWLSTCFPQCFHYVHVDLRTRSILHHSGMSSCHQSSTNMRRFLAFLKWKWVYFKFYNCKSFSKSLLEFHALFVHVREVDILKRHYHVAMLYQVHCLVEKSTVTCVLYINMYLYLMN